ncbi:MAG: tetratricopeptide repeat protein [Flavobacteriales bacterium]|nr:tetratricopeptide repeat protein [Flavobacteriales bacterium]
MKNLKFVVAPIALSLLLACGGGEEAKKDGVDPKAAEMVGRISTMEDTLFKSVTFDARSAQELLDVYKAFTKAYPMDENAPEYLFRAAGLCSKAMGDPVQGIKLYDRIIVDYPSWKRLPDTYYLKAFTIDTELKQKGEAQKAYQQVINLYPDHPFANDARQMMEYLLLTDEELIQKFESMEQAANAGQ